jgi:spermidine synthase
MKNKKNVYLATFLISFSTLALEVALSRLLSVTTWYHLAFFVVSSAMLGMTAGAVTVYIKSSYFTTENLDKISSRFSIGYSLAIPVTLLLLCLVPIEIHKNVMSFFALLITTIACFLPFYFFGVIITLVLTRYNLPIGKIYAADLIGASLGCLFVLWGLEILDVPSIILFCSAAGLLSALVFNYHAGTAKVNKYLALSFIILAVLAFLNSTSSYGIRPVVIKGSSIENTNSYELEDWNSFSRIVVYKQIEDSPQLWGASPIAPMDKKILQYKMNIDGRAGTVMRKFSTMDDIEHLKYDVTNIAYYLRPKGSACIIGVGAGKDVQSAILFGHEKITGIELNPIFIDLLENRFRSFAGIVGYKGVKLVLDEARTYFTKTDEKFSLIQMSLIDTWASTAAGSFSLSENILYTTEAWKLFFEHLDENGIFTVSRWYSPQNLGETGRVVSLASATLMQMGIKEPSKHIIMVASGPISTILICRQPFSEQDISILKQNSSRLLYNNIILPGLIPADIDLQDILKAQSEDELYSNIKNKPLNFEPSTDENPYFFNMLKLDNLNLPLYMQGGYIGGVIQGNMIATLTLLLLILSLLLLSVVTVFVPLLKGKKVNDKSLTRSRQFWPGAFYFSLIGIGFICLEIAFMQRLSTFLGHPIYALGIILFTILLSTGIGSLISEKLPLTKSPWLFLYPVITAVIIIIMRFAMTAIIADMITSKIIYKILISMVLIFPLGILMGFFFPTGFRLVKLVNVNETPWFWALNGAFGVLFSAVAVFISIYFTISVNFYISAICYILTLIMIFRLNKVNLIEVKPNVKKTENEPEKAIIK